MAFIPLTDEEKRMLQNEGMEEESSPETAGGGFGGINVSSIPGVRSARERMADVRSETIDAEADLQPEPMADLGVLARSGGVDLSPYEDEPFRGEERLNPAAPGSGMFVELSPKEKALVDGERRFSDSTRFLAGMYRDAQSYDPETYSRNVQASLATRIPVGMMVQDPEVRDEAWRQKMTLDQLDTLEKVGPKLRSWLQIPGRMAAVWDDLPALMALESLVEQEKYQAETSALVRGYRGNSALVERSQIGSKMMAGTATQQDLERLAVLEEEMARNQVEGEGLWATLTSGLGGQIAQRQEQARQALWGGSLGMLFAGTAASMALPLAGIPLLGAAAFGGAAGGMAAGAAAGATKAGFELESGTAFLEFRNITDENGNRIPEGAARIAALVYGAGASLVETAQFATLARFLPQGAKLFSKQALTQLLKTPTFRDALVSGAAEYGKTLTFEALTEGVQRGMEIAVGEGLKAYGNLTGGEFDHTTIKEAIAAVADETVSAFGSFALGLLPGGFTTFALDMKAANQARRNQNFFKALGEIASESKTLKRLPEGMGEYATELTKNGPVAEIGIDAKGFSETLMQIGADPEEVAGNLGIDADDLKEAAATGGDVWLPTGVYMEKIAGTELNQVLLQDLRLGEGKMTGREAAAWEQERQQRLKDDAADAQKYLEESGAETSDVDYAKSVVKTQLEGLGIKWLGKNEAESYSTLFAAYAVQAASRWNTTVKEWVDRLNLTIRDNADGTKSMVVGETRGQPVNDGVDISSEVTGVVINTRIPLERTGDFLRGEQRKKIEGSLSGKYTNDDTGWDINLSKSNISHAFYSATKNRDVDLKTSLEILSELPRLIKTAKLVESHDDFKGKEHVEKVHRMYVPVMFADDPGSVFKVRLTVKEMDGTFEGTVEGIYRAYDAGVTEKSARNRYRDVPREGPSNGQEAGTFAVILEDLLDGVKDSGGKFYLQDNGETRSQSMAAVDSEYLAAVQAGDMESAQKLVDEAAKEAGYGIGPVYHGTNAKFNTFDKDNVGTNYGKETPDHIGFFFTNRKEGDHPGGTAKDWARQSVEKKGGTSVVVGAYLKINNPFTISDYAASIGDDIDTIMTYAGDRQPVVDIFDNDSQYILNKAMEMGKDGIVFVDAFEGDSDGLYVAFEPEQIKSADPIVKDDQGNIIPLSERFNSKKTDIRYQMSTADTLDAEYLAAVEAGDEAAAQRLVDEAAAEAGFVVQHVFHGSKRIDRLGNELKPERATSGPMPFFTDDPTIAENYSKNKADTSIEIPESYTGWFKVAVGRGKPKTIDQAWLYLSLDKRRELAAKLPHVVNTDENGEVADEFRLTDDEYGMTNKSHWDFVLREKRGNVLAAAVEIWLDSGELFDQEERFLEILRLAGLDGVVYDSPWLEQPGVLEAHLAIRTPFDTSAISDDDFAALEAASKGKLGSANVVDEWDKRRFSGREWMDLLAQDRRDGTSFAWTSVPDWVSRELHRMGYDGIKDQGGKYTGEGHTVWIPFFPWQVKKADGITTDDRGNVIPLSQRFDTGVKDMRYQTAYHGSPHRFADFSNEYIGAGEGAQAFGWGLYFADKKEVAEYYRTSVTNRQPTDILIDGASIASWKEKMPPAPFPAMIRAALNGADGDIDRAKEYLLGRKEGNPNLSPNRSPNRLKQYDDAINFVESLRGHEIRIERPGPGQIYEVDIPDDNVLLDWDKPLNEQPEAIRKALKTVEGINVKSWLKGNPTGKEVYNQLVSRAQDAGFTIGKNYADDRQAASEILNGVGIKGIRYLDALSRDGSGDSRNYVIWDDKAIAIQQTYYQKSAGGRQYTTQGFINRSDMGITITLTPAANRSTFLHELGHLFLWDLESLVRAGKADSRTAGDWEVVRSWWGAHARDLAEWIAKHGTVSEDVRVLFAAPDGAGIVRAALAGKEADAALADAVRVAAEEYWARGFEQYLFEGVAPSRALRRVFDNFRRWLAKIYKVLKHAPDVELSDEVRAVMDRMLASEEEIDQERSLRESERMRSRLIQQGIPTVEADALREAADEAAAAAKTKLLALLMKELGAETVEEARRRREAAEPGIRAAMRGESAAWKTYDDLQRIADSGYNLAPDERYGEANIRLTSPEGTIPMEAAADLVGLSGVEELQALLAEEARSPFEAELNARLDDAVRDLADKASDPETMRTLAEESLRGEARLRLLALEQAILALKVQDLRFGEQPMEGQPSPWQTTARQARQMSAQVRAYREVAEQTIAGKRVRDARAASRYLAAARKAGREAYEFALQGKFQESLAAKDREMMSTALYQASLAAREELEKAESRLRKYWTGRKRLRVALGEEHFAQVIALTERYGFNGEDPLVTGRIPLGEWTTAANAEIGADPNNQGAQLPVAKWLITDDYKDRKMSWKDLTLEEFRDLMEAVEAIDYFGRSRNKLLAAQREADFTRAKQDLQASVTAVHGKLKETPLAPDYRGAGPVGRFLATSDRAEHILRRLDGFKDMAVAWLTFFDPVVKAERAEMKRMREAKSRLETIFSVYSSAERGEMTKKKYALQQLDPSTGKPLVLSKENVLALLLNWGARENREEVVFGYGFDRTVWNSGKGWIHYGSDEEYWTAFRMGSAEVEKLFSQVLEEKDYEVAQAVWDLNESYWGDIAAMSKKVTGVTPKKVKHLPVTSASGVTYRGGYMTLKFRPESNWDNFVVSEKESSKALYAPQGSRAHTKSGHTKERHQGERGKRLLRLDLGVETEHLRDALHDLYFRPVIRDLNKLLADPQVQKTIIGSIGMEAFKQFQPWVNGLANAYRTPSNYGEQMMQKVMGRTSAAILGWSLSSAAKQVFGWFPAVQVLGYKRTALAAFNFWRNPLQWGEMRDFAFGKSEYLRDRVRSFDRDVKAAMEAVTASPVRGKWSAVQETFFLFAGWMDMAVSLPVWTAAWDKGMLEFNGDEAKALEYADFVVRSTQNTGAAKDLAAIQQGSPAWKSMTMFYTAFGSMFQQTREQWFRGHGVRDIPRLAAFALFMYVLPALLEDLMSGRGPEEDEPDDILRWALNSTLQYTASQLILVRDVVNSASSGFSYRMSPMASAGTAAAKVLGDLGKTAGWILGGDEPKWEQIPVHLVEISGPAFGLPSNQIMRTMKAVGRYLDNDPDWSPWDFVITPPKKKSGSRRRR